MAEININKNTLQRKNFMSKIKITLNGEEKILPKAMTIANLIEEYQLDVKKIAIEKDLEIVNPQNFAEIVLQDGARLEIVHFIGGG